MASSIISIFWGGTAPGTVAWSKFPGLLKRYPRLPSSGYLRPDRRAGIHLSLPLARSPRCPPRPSNPIRLLPGRPANHTCDRDTLHLRRRGRSRRWHTLCKRLYPAKSARPKISFCSHSHSGREFKLGIYRWPSRSAHVQGGDTMLTASTGSVHRPPSGSVTCIAACS